MPAWLIVIIILAVLIAAAVFRCMYELRSLTVTGYSLVSDKIKEGDSLKAVFLSDLHGCEYGEDNEKLAKLIRDQEPDVILLGGDLVVSRDPKKDEKARTFIRQINSIAPVYYAPGNHEKGMEALKMFRTRNRNYVNFLKSEGIHYLKNDTVDLSSSVSVTGLDIDYGYYGKMHTKKMTSQAMAEYLGKTEKNRYNIILAHNPRFYKEYTENNADLVLSGHYHGGSIRLPLIGGIISPQFRLFPNYSKGKFSDNGTTMIVTGGCGSHTVNLRLFNKPEILVLNISGR